MSLDKLTQSSQSTATTPQPSLPNKRSYTWLLPVFLLIGFLAVITLLFGERLLPAVNVKTAAVITLRSGEVVVETNDTQEKLSTKGSMIFQASGWVEPDPYTIYVPTLINGIVNEVHVLEGATLKKGQLIATMIDDDAKLNLQESEQRISSLQANIEAHCVGIEIKQAELLAAQKNIDSQASQLADADDNYHRLKTLPKGSIAVQQVTQAKLNKTRQEAILAETKAQIPMIKAQLKQIDYQKTAMDSTLNELKTMRDRQQLALDRTKIHSPIDGIVLHLHAAPGKRRMIDMDTPKAEVIVEMYQPEKLQARIDVPLSEASGLIQGQYVELVSDLLPDTTFTGQVTSINGEADLQRNTLQAKVSITDPDPRLRPEMLLRAKFYNQGSTTQAGISPSNNSSRLSLYVPEAAIVENSSVWVVSPNDRAELRSIKLSSEKRDGYIKVTEGLRSGELVILPPHSELKEGSRITSK